MGEDKVVPLRGDEPERLDRLERSMRHLSDTCDKTHSLLFDMRTEIGDIRNEVLDEKSKRVKLPRQPPSVAVKVGGGVGIVGVIAAIAQAVPHIMKAVE